MLLSLDYLIPKYNVSLKGILHVGAHECEEMEMYQKYLLHNQVVWIEALPEKVQLCRSKFPRTIVLEAVVSDTDDEEVTFHVANNGQSSSMLSLGTHRIHHPHVEYIDTFVTKTKRTDKLLIDQLQHLSEFVHSFNFINLDIQGAELKALKGMESHLEHVDYIYTEVNKEELYEGACLLPELQEYLSRFGFKMVEISMTPFHWGDAFFIKSSL